MEKNLNAADRAKLDEYLTSVREVEKTVKRRAYWAERPKPSMDYELEDFDRKSVDGYVGTLLDLAVLALQTFYSSCYSTDSFFGKASKSQV